MRLSELNEEMLTKELVDRLLFGGLEYTGSYADLIITLGSTKACEYRVPLAARIYNEGRADKLMLCGGKVQKTKYGEIAEFKSMLIAADELGIPRGDIITEEMSMTTAENFEFARDIIERELPECRRIIVVTTAYHMRRALLLAQRIMTGYEIISAPADCGSARKEIWHTTKKGIRTAHEECMKLQYYAKNKYIENIDIQ